LFTDGTLAITLKVKKITKIFRKIRNFGDGEMDVEKIGIRVGLWKFAGRFRGIGRVPAGNAFAVENCEKP